MLRKSSLREIVHSLGRFLAIFAIMALGVGFFAGLRVTKTAMIKTEDNYLAENAMFDYRVLSTLGYDDAAVEAMASAEGVEDAEGAVFVDAPVTFGGQSELVFKFCSVTEKVNRLTVTEGRMPQAPDECVLDSRWGVSTDIGAQLQISEDADSETAEYFACDTYTVVGLVQSPLYLNFERGTTNLGSGSIAAFVYLLPDGFDVDYYTEIDLTLEETGSVYSDAYADALSAAEDSVTAAAENAAQARYDSLVEEARDQLAEYETAYQDGLDAYRDGQAEYEKGLAEYSQGQKDYEQALADYSQAKTDTQTQLRTALNELVSGQKQINASAAQLQSARDELDTQSAALSEGRAQLEEKAAALDAQRASALETYEAARDELNAAAAEIDRQLAALEGSGAQQEIEQLQAARAQIAQKLEALDAQYAAAQAQFSAYQDEIDASQAELDGLQAELEAGYAQLDASDAQLEQARMTLAANWNSYYVAQAEAEDGFASAETELEEARRQLELASDELEDARLELEDGKAELDDAQKELEDGRAEIDQIEKPSVYVLDRTTNVGYACFENDADIVKGVSNVFPLFFFLVAALICMTTMSRMVDEQRVQIGVLKALGYGNWAIAEKYLFYVGSSSLAGCIGGFYLGSWLIPKLLWHVYDIMYGFAPLTLVFDYRLGAVTTAAYLFSVLAVTWLCCRGALTGVPAELIRPKAPPSGKRIFLEYLPFIWKRFKFLQKVSARNVFRYVKRLLMMVLGVAGCTALLLTGFGINDSISGVVDDQYGEISLYDMAVTLSDDLSEKTRTELEAVEGAGQILFVHESAVKLSTGGSTGTAYLVAGDGAGIEDFINLCSDGGAVSWPDDGSAVVTSGIAAQLGISRGDRVTILYNETEPIEVTVSDICDNYIYNYVYMTAETFRQALGRAPEIRTALVNAADDADEYGLSAAFLDVSGVANVSVCSVMRDRVGSILGNLKYIVLLVIVCAGALAFAVIYNLTNISISERVREIATLKVLGFYPGELAMYIFRENLIMTGMGALVGLGLGKLLHLYVMAQIQIDLVSFANRIAPLSCLWAVLLTFAFAVVVDGFMYRRLEKINMAESLKSVE